MTRQELEHVRILFKERMIDIDTLRERVCALDSSEYPHDRLVAWAERRAREAMTA